MKGFFSPKGSVFSSGWVEISQEIDGVAGGFYLGACTQGKERRHNIRDEVST